MTCPSGKIVYATAREAWAFVRYRNSALARFTHKHRGQSGGVYRCPNCGKFHTTRGVNFKATPHDKKHDRRELDAPGESAVAGIAGRRE